MNIDNAMKIASMIATLSSVKSDDITARTIKEIDERIFEFAKALKFEERELESLLKGATKITLSSTKQQLLAGLAEAENKSEQYT